MLYNCKGYQLTLMQLHLEFQIFPYVSWLRSRDWSFL